MLPPSTFVAGTMNLAVVDPAQRSNEFVTHIKAERTPLHEPETVRIGRLSPTHEARLLGDEPEMLLVAIAMRLGDRKYALVDPFGS
jgi:hypothetical protein